MSKAITCFKAYDVRGRVPEQLNEDVAYRIGYAFATFLKAKRVLVGHDIRLSSPALTQALMHVITDAGTDVLFIGQCGTEEVYFGTFDQGVDGGVCVTASHNPIDYNGMKLVREGARPISGDTGLNEIKRMAEEDDIKPAAEKGKIIPLDNRQAFVNHLMSYVDVSALKPLKIVINAGNGGAGMVMDVIEKNLPFEFIKVNHTPDGHFPNGIPNPLLPENRSASIAAIKASGADLGIAWDGDFDRCFFFDEQGDFIEGYYLVGLLAKAFLAKNPGAKIVHDPRLTWNTIAEVEAAGGQAIMSKTGHAFIKERMRAEDAIYGGEMSAHHYFKTFSYCDSGMIPWLLVVELVCRSGKTLSQMISESMAAFPCSGEINSEVRDPQALIARIEHDYTARASSVDYTDGLSMSFGDWRFNLRMSNTEPVVRLNVESRGNKALMEAKRDELMAIIAAA